MRTIKLMPDYFSYPLWWTDGQDFGDIDPRTLPINEELANELLAWADRFDDTYNEEDPAESGFVSSDASEKFDQDGIQLWLRLREELSSQYNVTYQSVRREQLLEVPEQLDGPEPPSNSMTK